MYADITVAGSTPLLLAGTTPLLVPYVTNEALKHFKRHTGISGNYHNISFLDVA